MLRVAAAATILSVGSLVAFSSPSASPTTPQKEKTRAESEKVDFHTEGEVSGNKTFVQDIGHDLVFRLVPPEGGENAGWIIEIGPKSDADDEGIEFSAIATPPYHAYNERCIATVYGRSASDVVNLKDRTFYFVESVDGEHRAEEVVNAALYPTNVSDEDRVRIVDEQKQIQLGKGELRILKAHILRPRSASDLGGIESLRFEVNIELSSGLTMANIILRVAHPQ